MGTLRHFLRIIDLQTFVITALAVLSTYLSRRFGFVADLPIDLLGLAVVFPLVFSINSAYRMREDALQAFASLKGHAIALYYIHRDWPEKGGKPAARVQKLLDRLLSTLVEHLKTADQPRGDSRAGVFAIFSDFSSSMERLRKAGVSDVEISRANEYLKNIMVDFERMSNIARYRTPVALRAFTRLFLNAFPILFGPHFANIDYPDFPIIGYLVAALYAFVLVSLDNVQDHLENPFDGLGPDDLRLDVAEEILDVLEPEKG